MERVIAATSFRDTSAEEWEMAFRRSRERDLDEAGEHVLNLLRSQESVRSSGFQVNSYTHALQAATKAQAAGMDEEYVVCALLHDVGEIVRNFVSPDNYWMVANHPIFQLHFRDHSRYDRAACERHRGHPAFERT